MSDCFKPTDISSGLPVPFSDGSCAADGTFISGVPITSVWLNNLIDNLTEVVTESGVDDADCSDVLKRGIEAMMWQRIAESSKSISGPCGTGPIPAIGPYLEIDGTGAVVAMYVNGVVFVATDGFQYCCDGGDVWTFTSDPDGDPSTADGTWAQVVASSIWENFINSTIMTSSGTFSLPYDAEVELMVVGGGGSGGAAYENSAGGQSSASGGGSGAMAYKTVTLPANTPLSVLIGAGGASVSESFNVPQAGNNGSATTVSGSGLSISAPGGGAGQTSSGINAAGGAAASIATGGDLNFAGVAAPNANVGSPSINNGNYANAGAASNFFNATFAFSNTSNPVTSQAGTGSAGVAAAVTAGAGTMGAGGGGAAVLNNGGSTPAISGAGGNGFVRIAHNPVL